MTQKNIHGINVTFTKSNDGIHKYTAKFTEDGHKRTIKFGAIGYEHYHDKLGQYSNLNHEDKQRRNNYKTRHEKDRHWKGKITAGYLSDYILWVVMIFSFISM